MLLQSRATGRVDTGNQCTDEVFGALGPIVQELIIPRLYDQKAAEASGDLGPVFTLLFGGAIIGTLFCAALVWRNRGGKGV